MNDPKNNTYFFHSFLAAAHLDQDIINALAEFPIDSPVYCAIKQLYYHFGDPSMNDHMRLLREEQTLHQQQKERIQTLKMEKARHQLSVQQQEPQLQKQVPSEDLSSAAPSARSSAQDKLQFQESERFTQILATNITRKPEGRRFNNEEFLLFALCLQSLSDSAYKFLRVALPFPSQQALHDHYGAFLRDLTNMLTTLALLPKLLQLYKEQLDLPDLVCTVMVDAASHATLGVPKSPFTGLSEEAKDSKFIHLFLLAPLDPSYPALPLHIFPSPSGKYQSTVEQTRITIMKILQTAGFDAKFFAVDGDSSHSEHFKDHGLSSGTLSQYLSYVHNTETVYVTDPLHYLKRIRVALLNSKCRFLCGPRTALVLQSDLETLFQGELYVTDGSNTGAMRDSYAKELFSLHNTLIAYHQRQYGAFLCLMIFSLFAEAIFVHSWSRSTRVWLLTTCFLLYEKCTETGSLPELTLPFRAMRLTQTIAALLYALDQYPTLDIARLGTHLLENFFGLMRMKCRHDDRYTVMVAAIVHITIEKLNKNKFYAKIKIAKRTNDGGVKILPADTGSEPPGLTAAEASAEIYRLALDTEPPTRLLVWMTAHCAPYKITRHLIGGSVAIQARCFKSIPKRKARSESQGTSQRTATAWMPRGTLGLTQGYSCRTTLHNDELPVEHTESEFLE